MGCTVGVAGRPGPNVQRLQPKQGGAIVSPSAYTLQPSLGRERSVEEITSCESVFDGSEPEEFACKQHYDCKCQEYIATYGQNVFNLFGDKVNVRLNKGKHLLVKVGGGWQTFEEYLERHEPVQMMVSNRRESSPIDERLKDRHFDIPWSPHRGRKKTTETFAAKNGFMVFKSTYKGNEAGKMSGDTGSERKKRRLCRTSRPAAEPSAPDEGSSCDAELPCDVDSTPSTSAQESTQDVMAEHVPESSTPL